MMAKMDLPTLTSTMEITTKGSTINSKSPKMAYNAALR
jgi:hypothetical protein